ncbi:MAG: class I SAM-dependent methyltransferase [Bacteroidia bacterium]|jgi:hypothetical protein|nr:class I SAM-dependent methyltransferase [Bacteroidia bacterium]
MNIKSTLTKLIPQSILNRYVKFKRQIRWKGKSHEEIFTTIAEENYWKGKESVSGLGSGDSETKNLIAIVEKLIARYEPKVFVDAPCGDFYWMKKINFKGCQYIGGDIVNDIIKKNTEQFGSDTHKFIKLNILSDKLPDADVLFCRDCLVHFSEKDVFTAIANICNSNIKYLVTTSFVDALHNEKIVTGHWRKLNLQIAPFFFPKPIEIIPEFTDSYLPEEVLPFKDKSLLVWSVDEIRKLNLSNA